MSQDRNQENRFRPFLYHSLSLWPWGKTVTSRLLKVKSWRISIIISRQVKINKIRFIFFPGRMLINPLPPDDVHAEGDTGSKTDQVTKTIKNKDTTTRSTTVWVLKIAALLEGIPGDTPQHADPTLILFHRRCSKSRLEVRCQTAWIFGVAISVSYINF